MNFYQTFWWSVKRVPQMKSIGMSTGKVVQLRFQENVILSLNKHTHDSGS